MTRFNWCFILYDYFEIFACEANLGNCKFMFIATNTHSKVLSYTLFIYTDYLDNTEDDIYHDACGCQQCTYVTATSQCQEYADSLSDDDVSAGNEISPKTNENHRLALSNVGCCEYDSIVSGDIWRYNHIVKNTDDYDIGNDDSDDSDSSDDYRDDEYVDAMETTYV
jgi:hypothetical protein